MADGTRNVLPDLSAQLAAMQAMLDAQAAEIARLRAAPAQNLRCKISEKGALMVMGLGQWPITLYRSQWERLIPFIPEVQAFIKANAGLLSVKPPKE